DSLPGTDGVFDPTISQSGQNGGPTGDYVLNLQVRPPVNPPQVIAANPAEGTTLAAPPTRLTVQFSAAVNLTELAQTAVQGLIGTGASPLVFVDQNAVHDLAHPQDLGVLFRHDLQAGVTIQRDFTQNPATAPADTSDNYQFQLPETMGFFVNFLSSNLPPGTV